jgi:hypothetical protein
MRRLGRCLMAVLLLLPLTSIAHAQAPAGSTALELHVGYGGGGLHPDELVGAGVSYRFWAKLDGIGFITAVVAQPTGRAVFTGMGLRLNALRGSVRPYIAVGPLVAMRSYAKGRLGEFGSLGLEVVVAGRPWHWGFFLEGRTLHGRGRWTQLVGGVRATIFGN